LTTANSSKLQPQHLSQDQASTVVQEEAQITSFPHGRRVTHKEQSLELLDLIFESIGHFGGFVLLFIPCSNLSLALLLSCVDTRKTTWIEDI
jgi:hypothetical protein